MVKVQIKINPTLLIIVLLFWNSEASTFSSQSSINQAYISANASNSFSQDWCILEGNSPVSLSVCLNTTAGILLDSQSLYSNTNSNAITVLPELTALSVTSARQYSDCLAYILTNFTNETDYAYTIYPQSNNAANLNFTKRQSQAPKGMQLLGSAGAYNYQLLHMKNSTSDQQSIQVFPVVNNSFTASTPASLISIPQTKLQFDTWVDQGVLTLYVLADNLTLLVHVVDLQAQNNTRVQQQITLQTNCFSVQATKMFIWLSCSQIVLVLDRLTLVVLNTLQTSQVQTITIGNQTSLPLHIVDFGVQNQAFYLDFNVTDSPFYSLKCFNVITNGSKSITVDQIVVDSFNDTVQVVEIARHAAVIMKGQPQTLSFYSICALDQFTTDNITCQQCPLGTYSVNTNSAQCLNCAFARSRLLTAVQKSNLEFFCQNKIGQISLNDGVFDLSVFPNTESVDLSSLTLYNWTGIFQILPAYNKTIVPVQVGGKKISNGLVALFILLGVGFLLPWSFLTIYFIRKRKRLQQLQYQKDTYHLMLIQMTQDGVLKRLDQRGPNNEIYQEAEFREYRFQHIERLAFERPFITISDEKKTKTTCAICVEDFQITDQVRETLCQHVFHSVCLMMWARQKIWSSIKKMGLPQCPCCNFSLTDAVQKKSITPQSSLEAEQDQPSVQENDNSISQTQNRQRHQIQGIISEDEAIQSIANRRLVRFGQLDSLAEQNSDSSNDAYLRRRLRYEEMKKDQLDQQEGYYSINEQPTVSNVLGTRKNKEVSISQADRSGPDDQRSRQESELKSVRHDTLADKFKHASLKLIEKIDSVRVKNKKVDFELQPRRQQSITLSGQFSDGFQSQGVIGAKNTVNSQKKFQTVKLQQRPAMNITDDEANIGGIASRPHSRPTSILGLKSPSAIIDLRRKTAPQVISSYNDFSAKGNTESKVTTTLQPDQKQAEANFISN